jgi:DNA helicase II / ATP-dependent DNA helicase PcrA
MMTICANKPELVIAGPGAGKTHDMVDRIIGALPSLSPSRYLAAITFTNAATNNIRNSVHRIRRPGSNVFIGTIHSFANRFILQPFARPFERLPNDRLFAAIEIDLSKRVAGKKPLSPVGRNAVRKAITKKLLRKGIVPYNEMIGLCCDLFDNAHIVDLVCNRLQFLFIDEFQDVDTRQFELFEKLRKGKRTQIFAVGDPEQFIYSFTYGQRGVKAPLFSGLPLFRFLKVAETNLIDVNKRSCQEIVEFTNHFRLHAKQQSKVGARGEQRVLFLPETDLTCTVQHFQQCSQHISQRRDEMKRLYLAYKNDMFDEVRQRFGIRHISNSARQNRTLLQDALEFLALCHGTSQRKAWDELKINEHEWRKWGLCLLRNLRDNQFMDIQSLVEQWLPRLGVAFGLQEREKAALEMCAHLKVAIAAGRTIRGEDWSSSIHRAKGLEASAVLVVASSISELNKWCTTDRSLRDTDKVDTCRIGFVGFTRAMELLCIACCEKLKPETQKHLEHLGVTVLSTGNS